MDATERAILAARAPILRIPRGLDMFSWQGASPAASLQLGRGHGLSLSTTATLKSSS